MPELPEVETVRRSLQPMIGRRITGAEVREPRLRRPVAEDFARRLTGRRIVALERSGKYLVFRLSSGEALVVHLGMTGVLQLQPQGVPPRPHDHVRVRLTRNLQMTLNDPRRFGLMQIVSPDTCAELRQVGPDPLTRTFGVANLLRAARGRKRPVKNLLMDQRVLGGIGNIYANEILFRAGIRPSRQCRRLARREILRLLRATRSVLRAAIRSGGSSISDYRDGQGRPGYFQFRLQVYDRADEPCRRCRTLIRRTVLAGRSSFYCPTCQH